MSKYKKTNWNEVLSKLPINSFTLEFACFELNEPRALHKYIKPLVRMNKLQHVSGTIYTTVK